MPTPVTPADPAAAPIPNGQASIYLLLATATSTVLATVASIRDGVYTTETLVPGLAAGAFLIAFAHGKYKQATAKILVSGPVSPSNAGVA